MKTRSAEGNFKKIESNKMLGRKKYAKRLTQEETKRIIRSRIKLNKLFLQRPFYREQCWRAVAADAGVTMDTEALTKKWANLRNVYKKLAESPAEMGSSDDELTAANWPYFKDMDEWESGRPKIMFTSVDNLMNTSSSEGNLKEVENKMLGKRKYAKRLTQEETKRIIRSRIKLNQLFIQRPFKGRKCWRAVAADAGVTMDTEALTKKWANLRNVYKKLAESQAEIGSSDDELTAGNWPYFKDMDEWRKIAKYPEPPLEVLIKSDELNSSSSVMSLVAQSISSISTGGGSVMNEETEKVLQEILDRGKIMEKKVNKIYKGMSFIFKAKYDIDLEESDCE